MFFLVACFRPLTLPTDKSMLQLLLSQVGGGGDLGVSVRKIDFLVMIICCDAGSGTIQADGGLNWISGDPSFVRVSLISSLLFFCSLCAFALPTRNDPYFLLAS